MSRALERAFAERVPEVTWTDHVHQSYVCLDLRRIAAEATFIAVDTIASRNFRPFIFNRVTIGRAGGSVGFA